MATDITPPDPDVILDLISAFRRSKVMFTAVSLGLFDALADGPKSAPDLARQIQASPDALGRLQRVGLVRRRGGDQGDDGGWARRGR